MRTKLLVGLLALCIQTCHVVCWVQAQAVTKPGAELHLVADGYRFTEGPAVDRDGNVFFTDQPNDRILRWTIGGKIETWLQPAGRSNGLFFDGDGNLIACADGKNELWKIAPDKTHEVLLSGFEGKLFNGPNDVWVDQGGNCYFTDPFYKRPYWNPPRDNSELPKRVYRLSAADQTLQVVAGDFKQPNGIIGDARRSVLYVADIGDGKTYRFHIEPNGSLSGRELFCEMGSDGMTIDREGNVYLTGRGVTVFNPSGEKIEVIEVPEKWTANVCFAGSDRELLFITASDSVYTIEMKARGQ